MDDLEVGRADSDCVDTHQHFRFRRHWNRLVLEGELTRITQNPRLHGFRYFIVRTGFDTLRHGHRSNSRLFRGRNRLIYALPDFEAAWVPPNRSEMAAAQSLTAAFTLSRSLPLARISGIEQLTDPMTAPA